MYLTKSQKAANDLINSGIIGLQKFYTQSLEEMLWDGRKKLWFDFFSSQLDRAKDDDKRGSADFKISL